MNVLLVEGKEHGEVQIIEIGLNRILGQGDVFGVRGLNSDLGLYGVPCGTPLFVMFNNRIFNNLQVGIGDPISGLQAHIKKDIQYESNRGEI